MPVIPLPPHVGVGFSSPIPLDVTGYKYTQLKGFHNYEMTKDALEWPAICSQPSHKVIDGFSPNLNKQLHCGHLKNLATAAALANLLGGKPVAMLGASKGVHAGCLETYQKWCSLAHYNPTIYLDTELPAADKTLLTPGTGEKEGCLMFNDVVVYKSNGSPTYAAHDLAFAKLVGPDFYLTGAEQKEHFTSLGLGDKHISLGLLLGSSGKKMSSTDKLKPSDSNIVEASGVSAEELFNEVQSCLYESTPHKRKLTWNILAWQFNSSSVSSNTKFNPELWAKPESPGLYITYTFAKVNKAVQAATQGDIPNLDTSLLSEEAIKLIGFSNYKHYYQAKAYEKLAPNYLALFALALARELSSMYKKYPIVGGSVSTITSLHHANTILKELMLIIGMYALEEV